MSQTPEPCLNNRTLFSRDGCRRRPRTIPALRSVAMTPDIGHPSWMIFLTSTPTIRKQDYRSVIKANSENELILLTATSHVQKYRTWPVLRQPKDAWIRRCPGDPNFGESEPPDARIRVGLSMKHNVTAPCGFYLINAGTTAYLVGILLNPENMLPQLLRILDARLRLEKRLFLGM